MDIFSQKNAIMVFCPKNKVNEWKRKGIELNGVWEMEYVRMNSSGMIKISR